MNKFNPTLDEKLTGLMIYLLFKSQAGLDAFYVADYFGMNASEAEDPDQETTDVDESIKNWIKLGGKVNFAWFENNGDLDHLTMGEFPFGQLRIQNPTLHKEMKIFIDKFSKRWSNDWKQIQPKILAARSLADMKPGPNALELTWQSIVSACARKLQRSNKSMESKKVLELTFQNVSNNLKIQQSTA
jgi:hypothetical protein